MDVSCRNNYPVKVELIDSKLANKNINTSSAIGTSEVSYTDKIIDHLRKLKLSSSVSEDELSVQLQKPPSPPSEYEIHPPNFIGIGSQKCGTTWWHRLINLHPEVYNSSHLIGKASPSYLKKERHFFDRFFSQKFSDNDASEYAQWSARPRGMISGEWTPRYLVEHWAPPLVKAAAPNARLLVLVRDPVTRFISGMRHAARHKTLVAQDAHVAYLRGLYHRQLEFWLKTFPKSQLLVLQYEKCQLETQSELNRTMEFLGLASNTVDPAKFDSKSNPTKNQSAYSIDPTHRQSLVEAYRDDVDNLLRDFPEIDGQLWKNFSS